MGLHGFNSRVRGGRDCNICIIPATDYVSTHASAGDATETLGQYTGLKEFQLTRPRGTRRRDRIGTAGHSCFNSRVRGGRDLYKSVFSALCLVSTHASAGDATFSRHIASNAGPFQLTRPRGTRRDNCARFAPRLEFQLTRPRGTRRALACEVKMTIEVSTHASAGDATILRGR